MELTKEQQVTIARMAREWAEKNTTYGKARYQDVIAGYIEGAEVADGMLAPELIRLRAEVMDLTLKLDQSIKNTQEAIDTIKKADEVELEMIERMKVENAHLREIIKGKEIDARLYIREIQRLETENANLKTDNERLEQWQRKAIALYGPADDYVRQYEDVFGLKAGDSIQDHVMTALKHYRKWKSWNPDEV